MKHLILIIMLMFSITSCNNHKSTIPKEEVVEEDSLFQDYINLGEKLKDAISIDPVTFAASCMIVHYCESNLKPHSVGKGESIHNNQTSIFQITEKTRKALNIPPLINLSRKEQIIYYEVYLRACPKKALYNIKNSVDLHILHFAPYRTDKKVLSKVSNKYLKALDIDGDNVITKEDIALFEKQRVKCSKQIQNIFDSFYSNNT